MKISISLGFVLEKLKLEIFLKWLSGLNGLKIAQNLLKPMLKWLLLLAHAQSPVRDVKTFKDCQSHDIVLLNLAVPMWMHLKLDFNIKKTSAPILSITSV
jgi:hypothetical protein